MTTITLSTIAEFTASVGAPRVAAIEYPPGRPFGQPGDAEHQTRVLRATFEALESITNPGETIHLSFQWPEPPGKTRWHPPEPSPITKLLKRRPWLYPKLVSGKIPD